MHLSQRSSFRKAWESHSFRRLLLVRLCSQLGDGLFQIGLASLFFFTPERMTTLPGVALAFAVLLLPFTVVGPFAGPILDRWSRQRVLVLGNLSRAALTLLALYAFWLNQNSYWVYAFALIAIGVNRFLLAALSAALPLTVPKEALLIANSIVPSLGGIAVAAGAIFGAIAKFFILDGVAQDLLLLFLASVFFCSAALVAQGFQVNALGPKVITVVHTRHVVGNVISELTESARVLWQLRTPAYALGAMGLHRSFYALNLISFILLARSGVLTSGGVELSSGFADFAVILSFSLAGNGVAILFTAWIGKYLSATRWIVTCVAITAFAQAVLTFGPGEIIIYIAGFLLGFGTQGGKIAVDTIVHSETPDAYRGRAFIWYDMLYNFGFVGAAGVAVLLLPVSGWSFELFAGLFFAQLLFAGIFFWINRKI